MRVNREGKGLSGVLARVGSKKGFKGGEAVMEARKTERKEE